ncbi:MAG: prepilin-type N-terminal cleavage/methylation domain-containing protein [Candidatus Aminicenantes bacterium]
MKTKKKRGFSLIEVLVGLFLVAVAVLGLAQLFLLAVANNHKADRVSTATNLAQQQIERLRSLTSEELVVVSALTLAEGDEVIDINLDLTNDYRRITTVEVTDFVFLARVFVYSAEKLGIPDPETLLADPVRHRPRAFLSTIITR